MPTGWVLCKMGACWTVATQSVCLLIFYHSILHAWCCASLSAIPACMVSHYQPFLLQWCLTICHAFGCDASRSTMPSGVLPQYRPCLLVLSLTIGHAFWCGPSLSTMPIGVVPHNYPCLLVRCHSNRNFYYFCADRRMVTNLVLLVQRCHHIRHVCWSGAFLRYTCMYSATLSDMQPGLFIQICVFVK